MKYCTSPKCEQVNPQPLENFAKRNGIGDGYQYHCMKCKREEKRKWYYANLERCRATTREYSAKHREQVRASTKRWAKENPDKVKEYYLKKKYLINLAQYNQAMIDQDHKCALCKKPHGKRNNSLFVDHCHATKKFRGLICYSCNTGLGHFKDSIPALEAAVAYLKKHS